MWLSDNQSMFRELVLGLVVEDVVRWLVLQRLGWFSALAVGMQPDDELQRSRALGLTAPPSFQVVSSSSVE